MLNLAAECVKLVFPCRFIYLLCPFSISICVTRVCVVDFTSFSTSLQDLLDLDVVGTEAAVELEVVGVVEERTPKREQQLL